MLDLLLAGGVVGGDYYFNYQLPQKLSSSNLTTAVAAPSPTKNLSSQAGQAKAVSGVFVDRASASEDWSQRYKRHFSDTVVSTDTVYKSKNISIELTHVSYDSGKIDRSENGKHVDYGTTVCYTLADVYISSINCLRTVFAKDTYGIGYSDTLRSMSDRIKSVLAINGDSYSNNRHQNNGTIIRNGTVYRAKPSTEETCVLYRDGTMKIYTPDTFDAAQAIRDGAWQTWVFGPSLLDENGRAKNNFLTWKYITESHPRTAIGYYEPGHYCFLVADGRKTGAARGMFLEEMSQVFADLGCRAAYNLDGGQSSSMTLQGNLASSPYNPGQTIDDGIMLVEPNQEG
jgi:exopolysaccharide biosynthesis protein